MAVFVAVTDGFGMEVLRVLISDNEEVAVATEVMKGCEETLPEDSRDLMTV